MKRAPAFPRKRWRAAWERRFPRNSRSAPPRRRRSKNCKVIIVFTSCLRGEAIMRLSRLIRETLDKLPFPEDVAVAVDVDPYQLL